MNTQTHLLMATAVLLPAAPMLMRRARGVAGAGAGSGSGSGSGSELEIRLSGFQITLAALIGAMLPDASLYIMFIVAKVQGVATEVIFSDWYFSAEWQRLGAMTNSLPVYTGVAALAYLMRLHRVTLIALAALMHCITDFPLHHDDGHPHFWPFSDWIYSSPVSYWDPKHFGNQWGLVELCFAAAMIVFLWRRSANKLSRGFLAIAGASYAVVAFFWFTAFG